MPARITSTHGKVDLDAEGKIHATTTYIYGKDGVSLAGADILLDGSQAKQKYSQTDAYQFRGLSVGLGGRAMKKLNDAYVFSGNALRAQDKRLAVLEGLEAGKSWKEAKNYWNREGKNGLTLSVALTQEKQEQKYDSIIVRYEGGKLASDKDIVLKVKDTKNGQVKLVGQTLTGKKIRLETYKVDLSAGKNTTESHSASQSSGGHVGADIGSQGFTPDIGFNAARGKTSEKGESWTPTLLNGDHVSIEAGGDLNIDGSFVMGKKVDVTVGGNMRIASRQNSYSYHAKNSAIGGGVSLKSGGASLGKEQRDYSLKTVAEQAGIFAGKEGLTVKVKGKTTLVGAVIDSQGKKEKNQVTTGDLELKDMDNVVSLTSKGGGVGYQSGEGTKVNEQGLTPMPVIGVDSKTKSKTYAAIVDGKLEITGNKKIKVEDINRNTQHTLNALENSLNLRKLEERKRLSTLFAKHANEAIHVISEKNHWKEGSPEKVLLHAFVGA